LAHGPKTARSALDARIGARLRQRRIETGLSQRQLAESIGVSFQQIQKYEGGRSRVAASTLFALSDALDIDAAWFFEAPEEKAVERAAPVAAANEIALRGYGFRCFLARAPILFGDLPVAMYVTDETGVIRYFNPASERFAGRAPKIGVDRWCVSWRLYTEDLTPLSHDKCPMAVALREKKIIRGARAIAERPDGVRTRFEPQPTPILDAEGGLLGGVNFLLTEARAA
jgi:transcriptional regulator with XRE-family HTH domain